MEGEKIFAKHIQYIYNKGLTSRISKELIKLNLRKINNPIKIAEDLLEQTFLKRRNTQDQQLHELMLIIIIREMQIKTTLHTCQNGYYQNDKRQVLARMQRKGNPCTQWQGSTLVQPLRRREFPQKIKMELPYDLVILLLDIYPKMEINISKRYLLCHVHCSIIHKSQVTLET